MRLDGRDVTGLPAHRIARLGIGRTFQSPRLFPYLTIFQHVLLAARFRPRSEASLRTKAADEAEAMRALELVRLEHRADFPATREPTGRRKLVELAMVLAARPRVLLLDEPMAGLNPGEVQFAMRLIRRIRDERGAAVFWIEHVMEAMMGVADRVVVLHHGEKIAEGPPAAVAENPLRARRVPRGAGRLSPGPKGAVLEVDSVQAEYGDVPVIWEVSLAVGPGEIVALVGSQRRRQDDAAAPLLRPARGLPEDHARGGAIPRRGARGSRSGRDRESGQSRTCRKAGTCSRA